MSNTHANCPWCRTNEWLELRYNMINLLWVRCDLCACEGPLKQSQDEAWAAWDAWCKGEWLDKPTEPGWWWMKEANGRVYVERLVDEVDVSSYANSHFTWQGPIKPKE